MKSKNLAVISLAAIVLISNFSFYISGVCAQSFPGVYIGVDMAYGDVADAKTMIDQVSSYTNFFVIGTTQITHNITKIDETCQYLYDKGMYFSLFLDFPPSVPLLDLLRTKWIGHFLGFYAFDEVGGRQLDQASGYVTVTQATSYIDAANKFVNTTYRYLRSNASRFQFTTNYANSTEFALLTSDYALYWFDYKSGYDTVWAQLGWNCSRQLNIALCRGAATVQNKEWGAMITWKYTEPPYLSSGSEVYNDMVQAYLNGAKYVLIFDSNKDYTQNTLQQEHYDALRQFWLYTQNNSRNIKPTSERVAFVLPQAYAYGFRGPKDKIWGLWPSDDFSYSLSTNLGYQLEHSQDKLDIVYDDDPPPSAAGYNRLIYWNDSALSSSPNASNVPIPLQTNQPSVTATQSQTPQSGLTHPPTTSWSNEPTSASSFGKKSYEANYILVLTASGVAIATIATTKIILRKRKINQKTL
jgi:hypothetical protein